MSVNAIARRIPPYASDLRKNFEDLFFNNTDGLTQEQFYSISLAICYNLKNELMLNNFKYEARICLEEQHIQAITAAVVMMARNNTFYRYTSSVREGNIPQALIDLEETALSNAGIDKITLMMCLLSLSILNNCSACMSFYTNKLLKHSISEDTILLVARMTSVLKAVAEVIEIESIRSYEFIPRGENI